MIQKVKPSAIVIIAFMPIHGTAMAKTPPPKPADIAKVAAMARLMFPETPLFWVVCGLKVQAAVKLMF